MNKQTAIGGYFDIEIRANNIYHPIDNNVVLLNSARNCLEYILRAKDFEKIYIPYFTCSAVLEPINKLKINYEFYDIDNKLEPIFDFNKIKQNEAFLITNYFGIKDSYILNLSKTINNLIVDNAQSFYSKRLKNIDTFYSPRKFFGLPDGGILYTNKKIEVILEKDTSYDRMSHLLKRIDLSPEEGYQDFIMNDQSIDNQPIKAMSNLTWRLLQNVEYKSVKERRIENFNYLHNTLEGSNLLQIEMTKLEVPLVYPFRTNNWLLRDRLINEKIYCATYWPNVFNWCDDKTNSYHLAEQIIPLPIDQRYGKKELDRIIEVVI